MKYITSIFALWLCAVSCDSRVIDIQTRKESTMNVYNNECRDVHGELADKGMFKGQVTLIVNLASHCGYTPQYKELQALHEMIENQNMLPMLQEIVIEIQNVKVKFSSRAGSFAFLVSVCVRGRSVQTLQRRSIHIFSEGELHFRLGEVKKIKKCHSKM